MQIIKIETLRYGQPRCYADSIFSYRLTFTQVDACGITTPFPATHRQAKETIRSTVKPFKDDPCWWEPYLYSVEKVSDGVFVVTIKETYND